MNSSGTIPWFARFLTAVLYSSFNSSPDFPVRGFLDSAIASVKELYLSSLGSNKFLTSSISNPGGGLAPSTPLNQLRYSFFLFRLLLKLFDALLLEFLLGRRLKSL